MSDEFMLPIGTLLQDGKYRVERYMASGGFGNTYEIEHVKLGKRLAMKEFFMRGVNLRDGQSVTVSQPDNRAAFEQMRTKFLHEAQRLARLEEAHIVEVSDFFEENRTVYYVMKYVDGESLSQQLKRTGEPLQEADVTHILEQVLMALNYVHRQNLYHLDIKPGNIMVDGEDHVFLIDFGASKQYTAEEKMTLSTSTGLCYTPGYAPSEQIEGSMKRIGAWTDFYALGATLYNLLTNEQPPELSDVKYDKERAFHFLPSTSQAMRQLVMWMMKPDYPERPQTVLDISRRLESVKGRKEEPKPHVTPDNPHGGHQPGPVVVPRMNFTDYNMDEFNHALDKGQKLVGDIFSKVTKKATEVYNASTGSHPGQTNSGSSSTVVHPKSGSSDTVVHQDQPNSGSSDTVISQSNPQNPNAKPQPQPFAAKTQYYNGKPLDPTVARVMQVQRRKNLMMWGCLGAWILFGLFAMLIAVAGG